MARLLEPDEVPDDLASLIGTLLDLIAANRPKVQVKKWYHDMPIWLLIEPNGTLQIDVVLDAGRQRINCHWRTHEEQG